MVIPKAGRGKPARRQPARRHFKDNDGMRRGGGKPGGKRTHLIDLYKSAAACKALHAGSIPTSALHQIAIEAIARSAA